MTGKIFKKYSSILRLLTITFPLAACDQINAHEAIPEIIIPETTHETAHEATLENTYESTREIAAWINDFPIPVQSVQLEAIAQGLATPNTHLPVNSPEFSKILEQMIDQYLLSQEARKLGLDASPEIRHSLSSSRQRILANLLLEQWRAQNVNEASLREMYNAQRKLIKPGEEIRVQHILLNSQDNAIQIAKKLKNGSNFSKMAAQTSKDPQTAKKGGDLGYIRIEEAPGELRQVLHQLKIGQIGGPTRSLLGWHIVKITDRRSKPSPSFEKMRPQISRFLTLKTLDRELARLRSLARINHPKSKPSPKSPPYNHEN